MKIDKSNWKKVTLKDVAVKTGENIPLNHRKKGGYYIGGEHFNSADFNIKSRGIISDDYLGPAFHMVFKPGQTLYLSRNPQLQKVAYPNFVGICANTTYILETNKDIFREDLLPFLLIGDAFTRHAITHKRGSTNFYVNWSDINTFEFLLPPLDEQKKIADLLWSGDKLHIRYLELISKIGQFINSYLEESFVGYKERKSNLNIYFDCLHNHSSPPHLDLPYLALDNIEPGNIHPTSYQKANNVKSNCFQFSKGDVLYGKLRPYLDKAIVADRDGICSTELLVFKPKIISSMSLAYLLHSKSFLNYISKKGYGTKMPRVSEKIISEFMVREIKKDDIHSTNLKIEKLISLKINLIKNLDLQKVIFTQILNDVFM